MAKIDWTRAQELIGYEAAVAAMEARVAAVRAGTAPELVWLLEHPPLYTAGTSARDEDLLQTNRFPVYRSGRGGKFTYHGPGQRVAYVMLDLERRGRDMHAFVRALEDWLIETLGVFGVQGERRADRVGVWVKRTDGREEKIAALGLRVRHWVSFHGISLNVAPDLSHYAGIVPCGVKEHGVTSLAALGIAIAMDDIDHALRATFEARFGATSDVECPLSATLNASAVA
jgi:lipoyl(octanoyl) transferase